MPELHSHDKEVFPIPMPRQEAAVADIIHTDIKQAYEHMIQENEPERAVEVSPEVFEMRTIGEYIDHLQQEMVGQPMVIPVQMDEVITGITRKSEVDRAA